jgi:hypothetical protein
MAHHSTWESSASRTPIEGAGDALRLQNGVRESMVDDLVTTCQMIVRSLRSTAADVEQAGLTVYGHLLKTMASELELKVTRLLEAPADETPPSGIYLRRLVHDLETPKHWPSPVVAKWLATELLVGRRIVRDLLGPAEITGDAELIARAQGWLGELDEGPGPDGEP